MKYYEQSFRILSSYVDARRRLRLSTLFSMFQEAAIAHTEALGMGREKTLDRGLLWAVTMQRASVTRLPEYDDRVKLYSWPGTTMHVLFPRYYVLTDESGSPLVKASALWVLLDRDTRKFVFPESWGIQIEGVATGVESPLPSSLTVGETAGIGSFTVPYSAVDLNGHMNNVKYFDLAQDRMPAAMRDLPVKEAAAEYSGEARFGTEIELSERVEPQCYSLRGEAAGKHIFRLSIRV